MRRLLKDNRGQVRIIEAFLASMLILACLTLIPPQETSSTSHEEALLARAQNVLVTLDNNCYIGRLISDRNWEALRECLESAMPITVWFNLTIYDANNNILNDYAICSSGAVSNEVVSFTYVCAAPTRNYAVYVLQLQMAVIE